MYGEVPSLASALALPVLSPLHLIFTTSVKVTTMGMGWVIVTVAGAPAPLLSVTVTV